MDPIQNSPSYNLVPFLIQHLHVQSETGATGEKSTSAMYNQAFAKVTTIN